MNREIKFRGKSINQNMWLYGHLFQWGLTKGVLCVCCCVPNSYRDVYNIYAVNPETIGQYTGLKDKNGNDIYEGDIIAVEYNGVIDKCICTFEEGAFGLKYLIGDGKSIKEVGAITGFTPFMGCLHLEDFEVVGNIHDNTELLQ